MLLSKYLVYVLTVTAIALAPVLLCLPLAAWPVHNVSLGLAKYSLLGPYPLLSPGLPCPPLLLPPFTWMTLPLQ
jgi:hypothetical protein